MAVNFLDDGLEGLKVHMTNAFSETPSCHSPMRMYRDEGLAQKPNEI
jgi:hypothetical protein